MTEAYANNPILALIGGIGPSELFILLLLPLAYVLPIWLAFRKYGEGQSHWRALAILATVLFSWIGYILVSCVHAATGGYVEGRKPSRSRESQS